MNIFGLLILNLLINVIFILCNIKRKSKFLKRQLYSNELKHLKYKNDNMISRGIFNYNNKYRFLYIIIKKNYSNKIKRKNKIKQIGMTENINNMNNINNIDNNNKCRCLSSSSHIRSNIIGNTSYENVYINYLKDYIIDEKEKAIEKNIVNDEEEKKDKIYIPNNNMLNVKDIENVIHERIRKEEENLFEFLKSVNERYNLNCTLRVVGGWVRDKFLNISNDDIDITVDNMKGAEFCNYIKEYIKEKENKNFNFGIIKINSDQSKHLETSSFSLFNFQVDIVNLRNEKYTEESRIPEIVIGTPEEDALRRDFTVNSLFYNLKNKNVEDYTGKGLFHLKNHIISTPLDPLATFLDDPLRIIRCIRFCGFFNFFLEKSIFNVLKNEDIKIAFTKKISKSRLSSEILKIFSSKCKNIILSLTLLNYSSYSSKIFQLPSNYFLKDEEVFEKIKKKDKINRAVITSTQHYHSNDSVDKDHHIDNINDINYLSSNNNINKKKIHLQNVESNNICNNSNNTLSSNDIIQNKINNVYEQSDMNKGNHNNHCNNIMNIQNNDKQNFEEKWLFDGLNYIKFFKEIETNKLLKETFNNLDYKENMNYIQLCLFLLPLKNHFIYIKNGKTEYVVEYIIRESLKFPLKYSKFCIHIFEGFTHLYNLYKNIDVLNFLKNKNHQEEHNIQIKGQTVLCLKKIGEKWNFVFLIFYIFHKFNELNKNYITSITTNNICLSDFVAELYQYIFKFNLQDSYNIKPFLKWPDIKHNFPNISPNQINEVYEQIIKFMAIHGENEKECIEYLKQHFMK
ncbi:tRNA nucleotidyltransferase, putative [Plasmodium gaboni]|uniref:tRNA nucleotidyltransferase, putative n=1 Tax=Plasmodium gaboni TaxID=647221 RepID=A0ABY1UP33_9APIC|nr:tRNA nucleotidyltransferase, putative [Plasmodium gaboni]